jgi:hypothetical protein
MYIFISIYRNIKIINHLRQRITHRVIRLGKDLKYDSIIFVK